MATPESEMLAGFGFTKLEAAIYIALLREPRSSGYRIAQVLGKPAPNIYKAADSLVRRGAVLADESGRTRVFTALPITDYLDHRELDFRARRKELEQRLARFRPALDDDGIYPLEGFEQVIGRAGRMIRDAEETVMVDAMPEALARIDGLLSEAAGSGVRVIVKTYSPREIEGCEVVFSGHDSGTMGSLPTVWLNMVVDGRQLLLALLDRTTSEIVQAIWSRSLFLTLAIYNGFVCEYLLTRMEQGAGGKRLKEAFRRLLDANDNLLTRNLPAFRQFLDSCARKTVEEKE